MNKTQYLKELHGYLYTLPEEERDAALKYYEEFFADAGEENEQSVIADLGSPKDLAQGIIDSQGELSSPYRKWTTNEAPQDQPKGKMSGGMKVWFIILVVLSSPIWIGLVVGFGGAAIGILAALFVVIVAVWASLLAITVALVASGVFCVFFGIFSLFTYPISGITTAGVGFILLSVGLFCLIPFVLFTVKAIPAMFRGTINGISRLFHRKERRAPSAVSN